MTYHRIGKGKKMRKLEYLRNAMRKCKTMDDANSIQLPEEFRLSDDEDNYPFLSAVPVEKNGKDCLAIFVVHSRIVKRDVLARYGIFGTSQEERLFETYVIPVSSRFKFESPSKNPTKDYSNWGMTKEGFTSKGLSGVTLSSHHQDSVFGCHPRMSYPLIKL